MSESIVEVSAFSAEVVVPQTGEGVTAESLKVPVQSLTNRTRNLQDGPVAHPQGITRTVNGETVRRYASAPVRINAGPVAGEVLRIPDADIPNKSAFSLTATFQAFEVGSGGGGVYTTRVVNFACKKNGALTSTATNLVAVSGVTATASISYDSGDIVLTITTGAVVAVDVNVHALLELGPPWDDS